VDAGPGFKPGRRYDHGIDERPLDAVVGGWFVPFVDDANRDEQHPGPHVEAAGQKKVEVRLLELHFAALFQTCDKCVLQLELPDETNLRGKAVIEKEHEPVEIDDAVLPFRLVEVKIHVARNGAR